MIFHTAKKRVIFFDSNKCNFLKHLKLVKFNQNTLLNANAENEKIIFFNPIGNNPRGNGHLLLKLKGSIFLNNFFYSL